MIVAGCDVGSLTTKVVLMKDRRVLSHLIERSRTKPWQGAHDLLQKACAQAQIKSEDLACTIGTGYGRDRLSFVDATLSEIACHGLGAKWAAGNVNTVIDIGGQDCKAIRLDEQGRAIKFVTNDKCASGTGRFLEVMANLLQVGLHELGQMSKKAKSPIKFASTCTVWAQADVIQHVNNQVPIEDIGAGINNAMANRMATLVNNLGIQGNICMTGGVAKNEGVVSALEKALGKRIKRVRKADPQLIGAIGAACNAAQRL